MIFRRLALAAVMVVFGSAAFAAEHEIQMLNKGPDGQRMWYEPAVLVAEPGDTITFVSADKGHNSESMTIPEGAEKWKGKINKDLTITVDAEGVYSYKCTPHFGSGMVGFIVVGDPLVNLEEIESQKYAGKSKKVAAELIARIKEGL